MTKLMKKVDCLFIVLGILYCVGVLPHIVAAETAKKGVSEDTKI